MSTRQTAESFWARVDKGHADDCWLWTGALTSSGYGNLSWHGQHVQAHRVAYWLTHGGISLQTGFRRVGTARRYQRFVLHRCDSYACCNPRHLFLGTMRSNQLDAYKKQRKQQPKGSAHANSKLSKGVAVRIREEYNTGALQIELAKKHGISQRAISLIVRGETYKDEL